jgi:adenylate kinase family enzyme
MDRIQIIGCSAAGKSTVARELGSMLGIEVVHLDKEMWKPGCQLTPPHEEPAVVEKILKKKRWIIDGNYTATLAQRLEKAELIVMVDYPRWLCMLRAMKRIWTYFGRTRPDMGKGCPEKVNISFFKWIWRYPYDERPELLRLLNQHARDVRVVKLRGDRQCRRWLAAFRKRVGAPPVVDSRGTTAGGSANASESDRRARTSVAGN